MKLPTIKWKWWLDLKAFLKKLENEHNKLNAMSENEGTTTEQQPETSLETVGQPDASVDTTNIINETPEASEVPKESFPNEVEDDVKEGVGYIENEAKKFGKLVGSEFNKVKNIPTALENLSADMGNSIILLRDVYNTFISLLTKLDPATASEIVTTSNQLKAFGNGLANELKGNVAEITALSNDIHNIKALIAKYI